MHACMHVCMYICICTYTYTHIHTGLAGSGRNWVHALCPVFGSQSSKVSPRLLHRPLSRTSVTDQTQNNTCFWGCLRSIREVRIRKPSPESVPRRLLLADPATCAGTFNVTVTKHTSDYMYAHLRACVHTRVSLSLYIYIRIYMYIYTHTYMYIYIKREREREIHTHAHTTVIFNS